MLEEAHYLETWAISARLNHYMLDGIAPEAWLLKVPKSKSPAGHFAHIHNVRRMWLKSAAPEQLEGLDKLEDPTMEEVRAQLTASDAAMTVLLEQGLASGRVKGFKPHPMGYLGYLISHETFHRAQVELALRQLGHPLSDKVAFGFWEWGVR
ncbi:MAG: DinB family protein [Chthonomonas sp.]|nr:DinB family protein [Chthonomonas sp.]